VHFASGNCWPSRMAVNWISAGHPSVSGLGFIGDGHGRGLLQHFDPAVTTRWSPVGILHQIWWRRTRNPQGRDPASAGRQGSRNRICGSISIRAIGAVSPTTRLDPRDRIVAGTAKNETMQAPTPPVKAS